MKDLLAVVVGAIVVTLALFALAWFGLFAGRPMSKYATETDKQVYDTSRQYQQGTQLDLSRYCRQLADAQGPSRAAVADLIRDTAATYTGPLTPANRACLQEIGQ